MFNNELEIEKTIINKINERCLWALNLVEGDTYKEEAITIWCYRHLPGEGGSSWRAMRHTPSQGLQAEPSQGRECLGRKPAGHQR